MESVGAVLSLLRTVEGESVIKMRDEGLVADFDIFERGSVRDIMRFAGAGDYQSCG